MASAADLKRWDTLTSSISFESFDKNQGNIFKNFEAKEKTLFNKFEKDNKALEKKYLSGNPTAKDVKEANKASRELRSFYRAKFEDLEQKTGRAANVSRNKVYEDDKNIKRYGKSAMKGKGFATPRTQSYAKPTVVEAGASRKPTQKNTKK